MDQRESIFSTTHWTVVLSARDGGTGVADEPLAALCRTYWPPLYAFLRKQGFSAQEAEDLVQGFFEKFLARDYLRDVAREKGRFRSFLLASLRHYVSNELRAYRAQRRGGGQLAIPLDDPGVRERCEATAALLAEPEAAYDRVWATTLMDRAAHALRSEFAESGRLTLFESLRVWLVREPAVGEYADVGPRLGMTEGALAVAVLRMRRRFRELIRTEVAHTVQRPDQIDEEMSHMLRVLTS